MYVYYIYNLFSYYNKIQFKLYYYNYILLNFTRDIFRSCENWFVRFFRTFSSIVDSHENVLKIAREIFSCEFMGGRETLGMQEANGPPST